MDNKMAVFNNREFGSIRVIEENGNYLFCGFDVAKALVVIKEGQVTVNGEVEYQRGKKLHDGDVVTFDGETIKIEK